MEAGRGGTTRGWTVRRASSLGRIVLTPVQTASTAGYTRPSPCTTHLCNTPRRRSTHGRTLCAVQRQCTPDAHSRNRMSDAAGKDAAAEINHTACRRGMNNGVPATKRRNQRVRHHSSMRAYSRFAHSGGGGGGPTVYQHWGGDLAAPLVRAHAREEGIKTAGTKPQTHRSPVLSSSRTSSSLALGPVRSGKHLFLFPEVLPCTCTQFPIPCPHPLLLIR